MRWRAAIAGVVSLAGGTLVAPAIPVVAAVPADPSPAGSGSHLGLTESPLVAARPTAGNASWRAL